MDIKLLTTVDGNRVDVFETIQQKRTQVESTRPAAQRTIAICMLPRTGSTMLCSILEQTGSFGFPDEYLNPRGVVQMYAERYGTTGFDAYWQTLRRERATDNGTFSLKATYPDLLPLIQAQAVGRLLGPTTFIYLTRRDLLSQAVSAYKAQVSGLWHRDKAGRPYRSQVSTPATFDEAAILKKLDEFLAMQLAWERYFALRSIEPVRMTYEDLLEDVNAAVMRIASAAGIASPGPISMEMASTSKLADAQDEEWVARIRDKFRGELL